MDKKEIFKIIQENSYMKYCICELIENIKDSRECKDLKIYLENIILPNKMGFNKSIDEIYEILKKQQYYGKEKNNEK